MAEIQYKRYDTDTSLVDLGYDSAGYVISGKKTTAGAPAVTAGKFQAGCLISNSNDSDVYRNDGSIASPSWVAI